IEYDVTSHVTGNGLISFALVADSSDGIDLTSRQGVIVQRPQLVIDSAATGTVTPTAATAPTATASPSPTPSPPIAPTATATEPTPTSIATAAPSSTPDPTTAPTATAMATIELTPTATQEPSEGITLGSVADTRVSIDHPTTNNGSSSRLIAD